MSAPPVSPYPLLPVAMPLGPQPRSVAPRPRPLPRDATPAVETVFDGLSARSRYLRFHSPMPVLSAANRLALLNVDDRTHAAIVAELPTYDSWHPVGLTRLIANDPLRPSSPSPWSTAGRATASADGCSKHSARRLEISATPDSSVTCCATTVGSSG